MFSRPDGSAMKLFADTQKLAFIPRSTSPKKFRPRSPPSAFRSPDRGRSRRTPSISTNCTSYAVQDPFKDQAQAQFARQPMQRPSNPLHAVPPPNCLIAGLPPRWYGICPFSLAGVGCPLGIRCQFIPLCPSYNNAESDGCTSVNKGVPFTCRFAHEYRFCEDIVADGPAGCRWEGPLGNHPATKDGVKKKRDYHMKVRAHRWDYSLADWEARMMLLSLREAHARGMFNGQQLGNGPPGHMIL